MFSALQFGLRDLTPPLAAFGIDWFREPGSTGAAAVDSLYFGILAICVFFFVLIVGLMIAFMARYYARPGHTEEHTAHHNNLLEAAWSIIPGLLIVWIFAAGFIGYLDFRTPPEDAYEVQVNAKKWSWTFTYPNGVVTPNLHVPVDTPVKLVMSSDDVIHSLFIPAFRVKMDCVPGRYSTLWFEATKPTGEFDNTRDPFTTGTDENGYDLFCTEYCGQGHSTMIAKVVVHESGTFESWLEKADTFDPEGSPVEKGRELWLQRGCKQCHTIDGASSTGPTWKGAFGTEQLTNQGTITVDENYIRESILNPMAKIRDGFKGVMPSSQGQLKERDLAAIIWFIKSLKDGEDVPATWTEVGGVPGQDEEAPSGEEEATDGQSDASPAQPADGQPTEDQPTDAAPAAAN